MKKTGLQIVLATVPCDANVWRALGPERARIGDRDLVITARDGARVRDGRERWTNT